MLSIKDQKIVDDSWQRLVEITADAILPAGDIIVPFAYWLENKEVLLKRDSKLGICIDGDDETEEVAKDIEFFDLVALDFPAFTDGRAYSHACLLRERYNFQGELRAVGDVLRDQLFYMQRCGIDSFQLREDKESFLIDARGSVVERYIGPKEWDAPAYVERVRRLVVESRPEAGAQ